MLVPGTGVTDQGSSQVRDGVPNPNIPVSYILSYIPRVTGQPIKKKIETCASHHLKIIIR